MCDDVMCEIFLGTTAFESKMTPSSLIVFCCECNELNDRLHSQHHASCNTACCAYKGQLTNSSPQQKHGRIMNINNRSMKRTKKGALAAVGAVAILYSVDVSLEKKYLSTIYDPYQHRHVKLRIPSELDLESRRQLSLNLGRGNCLWQVRNMNHEIHPNIFLCSHLN